MPPTALLLLAAALVACVDWWAVVRVRRRVEIVAKPLTMALLMAVAAIAGEPAGDVRAWLVVGAAFGLVGDVALLGGSESAFMAGLGAFAVGHLALSFSAASVGFDPVWALPGAAVMVALIAYRFAGRIVPGALRQGGPVLAGAVVCYGAVISAMVVTAWGTASWLAAAGAVLFASSDWVLGHRRFAGSLPGGRLAVMVPYHLGQAALIMGLATAR